ncbi:alpha/beta fold hydrolase [Streptomyces clavuligerus]|uniref:Proteinase Secreted protein n=3 Tax=Streptomyces clavuligerus TaxID=1901 RepID=B5GT28_STRCL|nr:alpha/beta hydrolase [Streptomyces clavuligerus]ANW19069.1 proteinase [Streptomyces clavuligerus]AXU13652.1 alpha/beta hydrolase [Streptomyces clavuligerus]EDY49474.1 proteinase [Streptomyces clavuligerus]EFG08198.1 Proteinase Secreted protein [Streptomyces clavuligerus]MBY6303620.1 alpha/beta fold hydrolase [Streptomyces clavuligerus]
MHMSTRVLPNPHPRPHSQRRPVVRRRALSVLLALSASAAVVAPGAAVAQEGAGATAVAPPPIRWGACPANPPMPDPSPRAQCGTLRVPVDWANPQGPKTSVFVARYRATEPGKRVGVLMTNPGGPGNPGADAAMYADDPYDGYTPEMLQRFDIVSFDPRGIGRSEGIRCDESIAGKIPSRPRDAAEFERLRTLNGQLAESCLRQMGPLAAHMDTESVARDMDALRAAVGEQRISFLGHSYGTSIGERYARLFPQRLRALALDSAVAPGRVGAERFLTEGSAAVDDIFEKLLALCEKDTSCALKGQRLIDVTRELFARADAGTLRAPGTDGPTQEKIDADQLVDHLYGALRRLDPETATRDLAALHSGTGEVHLGDSGPERAWQLVLCRDDDLRIRDWAEYRAIRERVAKAAPYVRYSSQALDMVLGCQGWMPPKAPSGKAEAPSGKAKGLSGNVEGLSGKAKGTLPPVLVVNATHDAATPLAGARRMAAVFPKASLLTVDTVGHWMYALPEPKRAINAYLSGRG